MDKKKIIRAATVPQSLDVFCKGMLKELSEKYEVVALSSPGEPLDRVREREGVRTIAVPMEGPAGDDKSASQGASVYDSQYDTQGWTALYDGWKADGRAGTYSYIHGLGVAYFHRTEAEDIDAD